MWIAAACIAVGVLGGFGSVSRGSFFYTRTAMVFVGMTLPVMGALSTVFAWQHGWLAGVALFFFSLCVAGRFGARVLYRGIDRPLPADAPSLSIAEAEQAIRQMKRNCETRAAKQNS